MRWRRLVAWAALPLVLAGCYVPRYYSAGLPEGSGEAIPMDPFDDADSVLVIPCWMARKGPESCGPPAIAPVEALHDLSDFVETRSGIAIIDVFGHEGAYRAQHFSNLFLIGDNDGIVSIRGSVLGWEKPYVACVGPTIKATLLNYLRGGDAGVDDKDVLARWRVGQIEGDDGALRAARVFLERLEARGDDQWHPPGVAPEFGDAAGESVKEDPSLSGCKARLPIKEPRSAPSVE